MLNSQSNGLSIQNVSPVSVNYVDEFLRWTATSSSFPNAIIVG